MGKQKSAYLTLRRKFPPMRTGTRAHGSHSYDRHHARAEATAAITESLDDLHQEPSNVPSVLGGYAELFEGDNVYGRHSRKASYPDSVNGNIVHLTPLELLEVGRFQPSEHVIIAYFGDASTRVVYFGDDSSMLQTLDELKLPTTSSNLGEIVFKIFKQHLEIHPPVNKNISVEQGVHPGNESQFRLVLKKLAHVYNGGKVDNDFYAAL